MNRHTKGIVLQQLRFGESDLIVKIFTEEYGPLSFMVKGAYSKRSRIKPGFFQPLMLTEFETQIKIGRELHYITEISVEIPFHSLYLDNKKNAIVFFISELLSKTALEATTNKALFDFIHGAVQWLDLSEKDFANFHLYFMLELSRFLGFYPRLDTYNPAYVFDLLDGNFTPPHPSIFYTIGHSLCPSFYRLCRLSPDKLAELKLTRDERRQLLDHLITYYRLHLPGFRGMQSHEVLAVVLG